MATATLTAYETRNLAAMRASMTPAQRAELSATAGAIVTLVIADRMDAARKVSADFCGR